MESLFQLNARLYAEATPERLAKAAFVTKHRHCLIEATLIKTGRRSRFSACEHNNFGPGWMMYDLDDGDRVVNDSDLSDMVALPPNIPSDAA